MSDHDVIEEPEDRFVLTQDDGRATGTVFHWAECGWAGNIPPERRYVLDDSEIKLLGLRPCQSCWRLTQRPGLEEALSLMKRAARLAIEEIHRGRHSLAEGALHDTLSFVEGTSHRPSIESPDEGRIEPTE